MPIEDQPKLNEYQLRKTIDYLYDGNAHTFYYLHFIDVHFNRSHEIFLWMVRNKKRGQVLIDFFRNESGGDGKGMLQAVSTILNKIDGNRLVKKRLRTNELKH